MYNVPHFYNTIQHCLIHFSTVYYTFIQPYYILVKFYSLFPHGKSLVLHRQTLTHAAMPVNTGKHATCNI